MAEEQKRLASFDLTLGRCVDEDLIAKLPGHMRGEFGGIPQSIGMAESGLHYHASRRAAIFSGSCDADMLPCGTS